MRWDRVYWTGFFSALAVLLVWFAVTDPGTGWAVAALGGWFGGALALTVPLQRWENARPIYRVASAERIAALEREVLEPVDDVIARIDRELAPPKPREVARIPATQVGLAPASWWPEGGRTGLPPGVRSIEAQRTKRGLATSWLPAGSTFSPSCAECEWVEIRTVQGFVRHVLSTPCPTHVLRSTARP